MVAVITTAFGMFVYGALAEVAAPVGVSYRAEEFISIAFYEVAVGSTLLAFLFARGWRLPELGFAPLQVKDAAHTALLFVALWVVSWLAWVVVAPPVTSFDMTVANGELVEQRGIALSTALIFSLINASFEEFFVCAYVVSAWRGPSLSLAILLSSLIRLSYHLYQGPSAILAIIPFGLIAAWYFARTRRIAPLIAIHFVFDLFALLPYARL